MPPPPSPVLHLTLSPCHCSFGIRNRLQSWSHKRLLKLPRAVASPVSRAHPSSASSTRVTLM